MRRRSFLISCSTLALSALVSACGLPAGISPTAQPGLSLSATTAKQPATPTSAPVGTAPRPPATTTTAALASPASTATRATLQPPTPLAIDPAFGQKLATIPPEDLQWLIRRAPIGQDEVPPNLTDPYIGGADIFTTSGPILAVLFIGFRENTHRAYYNIYHTADLARQSFDGVVDLYQRTPGTTTSVPPGFPFPAQLAAGTTGTEGLILVGTVMIDARAGIDLPTTPVFQADALTLASAALAHLQRIILNQAAPPSATPMP
jgi:hypothetical protein